jgi:hypothetical protein
MSVMCFSSLSLFFPSPALWDHLQFNYLTAPANNLNVNLVHHQQKPFVSHPYSEHYYYESSNNNNRTYNSSTPNSTIRSVKNYRKPHPPVGTAVALQLPSGASYNVVMNTSATPSANNASYHTTNPLTNNLNHSYSNASNTYKFSQSNNLNHSNISKTDHNASTLSRRSSQSSSSHEWMAEKPHSLSLCINRINLKKSNKSSSSSASSKEGGGGGGGSAGAQFQSMRCRKHRNRNHFFNTSTSTSYQKYKLTKSCSNDTVNSDQPADIERNPPTTYKFI